MERRIDTSTMVHNSPTQVKVQAFLTANGIEPRDVIARAELLVTDTHVVAVGFARDADGHKRLEPFSEDPRSVLTPIIAPLVSPPEDHGLTL